MKALHWIFTSALVFALVQSADASAAQAAAGTKSAVAHAVPASPKADITADDGNDGQDDPEAIDARPDPAGVLSPEGTKYLVHAVAAKGLSFQAPHLPDLAPFTPQALMAKIQDKPRGHVTIKRMLEEPALDEFIGGKERLREWVERQKELPKAIFIEGGYMTPKDLLKVVPKKYFEQTAPGIYVARLPIVVRQGATLHIDKETQEFRLSQDRGAFLVNDGKMFVTDTRLTAWNEAAKTPAYFHSPKEFRPFLISWGGAELYMLNAVVTSLGYSSSKSYGVSISQYSPHMAQRMSRSRPTGWILNSEFSDLWYGFYCYEADNVVIRGSRYHDNIVYGIDPHDRSRGLIIAENEAWGTHKKHGIIVSREVNDSWIFDNRSHDNHLSGIVIDRSSVNNVVAQNEVYHNGSDGITIYESANNLLWKNRSVANHRHGIRLRNSTNIRLYDNLAVSNGLMGIYGHTKDLTGTNRNFKLDPFDPNVSMVVVGGKLIANGSGPVSIQSPLSVELYQVDILAPTKASGISMTGVLGANESEILNILFRKKQAVVIEPNDGSTISGS